MKTKAKQIVSRNSLFKGELVDKPMPVRVWIDDEHFTCPNCRRKVHHELDTGCLGAEPNCLFCNFCNCEVEL